MTKPMTALKEERLQKLFDDCQQQVLSQIIGPFGLGGLKEQVQHLM